MNEPCNLSAATARRLIGSRKLSPLELFDSCVKQIETINPAVNAIVAERFADARVEASHAESAVMQGDMLPPLHGLPLGVKDANETAGLRTTFGSLLFKDHVPVEDEGVVRAIRGDGAIVMGKTNTPEFTAGANTVNDVYGATRNPFDLAMTCGGSSGGTAVALACDMVPLAMGSDIGGSVRIPATFCGVVGHRPTPGLVPFDHRAMAMTPLDVQGPLARNVEDAALLLSSMATTGARDPMAYPRDAAKFRSLDRVDLGGLRIAISDDLGCAPVAQTIRETFSARMQSVANHVAMMDKKEPDFKSALDVFWIMRGMYFAAAHKENYDRRDEGLGAAVRSNYEAAMKMTMADVGWASREQMRLCQRFDDFFDDFDVLICPGVGVPPFPHTQNFPKEIDGAPMENYVHWVGLTSALSVTGHPITAIPCGYEPSGMPFGVQIIGPKYQDHFVLSVAAVFEELFESDSASARPVPKLEELK